MTMFNITFISSKSNMYKKSFLLNLEAEKLNSIDTYCKAMGIPRVKLFEELAEKWLSDNKNEIK